MQNTAALPQGLVPHNAQPGLMGTLRSLERLGAPLSEVEVRQLLSALASCRDELSCFERFEPDAYCRNRIFSNDFVDLLLLCWRPGQRTPIHDHAGSTCGVYVLRGEALEIGFKPSGLGPLIPSESRSVPAGKITVSSDEDIHLVANYSSTGEDLVTLHCYSPPLRSMRVFGEHETFFAEYGEVAARASASGCYHVNL